jgi:hypothetical protein
MANTTAGYYSDITVGQEKGGMGRGRGETEGRILQGMGM